VPRSQPPEMQVGQGVAVCFDGLAHSAIRRSGLMSSRTAPVSRIKPKDQFAMNSTICTS
jgi:hypothetical protein